jgi:glycosyltransferase involved in cell wall biosynthesis
MVKPSATRTRWLSKGELLSVESSGSGSVTADSGSIVGRVNDDRPVVVTVGIPTYRRPSGLARLVPLVLVQAEELQRDHPERFIIDVLIADNDPEGSAEPVWASLASSAVRYVMEPEPGLAAVRNRILDETAASDVIVMIDDDEWPTPGWLSALLQTWQADRPALVVGRVIAEFDGTLDPWVAATGYFRRRNHPTGFPMTAAATSNLLLDARQVRDAGFRFEARFGLSGGEDSLFSRRMFHSGARLVWCAESVVVDSVPLARMTRRYVLGRSRIHGNLHARIDLELSEAGAKRVRTRVRRGLIGAALVLLGAARWLLGRVIGSLHHQARGLRILMRGVGMIEAVFGLVHQEYKREESLDHARAGANI